MVELTPRSACAGLLPVTLGQAHLEEAELGVLTALSPLDGAEALSSALEAAHGMAWPKPNRATGKDGARCLWFGRDAALLVGPSPDPGLRKTAAVTDQSDGWASMILSGTAAEDVLARLVPVDLRAAHFRRGHSLRSELLHMQASITRLGADRFLILVFRSMADTAVHEIKSAMAAVAARG